MNIMRVLLRLSLLVIAFLLAYNLLGSRLYISNPVLPPGARPVFYPEIAPAVSLQAPSFPPKVTGSQRNLVKVGESGGEIWKAGGPTKEGNFVFLEWRPGEMFGSRLFLLSDYGFALINEGAYEHPKVVYALGFLKQKKVETYRTLAAFSAD